jgi:phytoene synthase
MAVPDAFVHCESLVRTADKDRFLACLFAPADRRRGLLALYAFNVEIAAIRERAGEPLAGEVRLQWWRDVLEGDRNEEARAHPVAAALIDTLARHSLPIADLVDLIEARAFDLYNDPMPTVAGLEAYARRTSSALMALAARVLGDPETVKEAVTPAGIAYAMAGLLRAFAFHASRGQLFVPLEILVRHAVAPQDVLAGRASSGLAAALAEMRGLVHRHLAAGRAPVAAAPAAIIPALLPVALVPGYLARMVRADYDPFHTVVDVPQWRRQWVLWRAARRGIRLPGA